MTPPAATVVLQAVAPAAPSPLTMVLGASPVTKIVLGFLAILSLVSWAIIIGKAWEFRRVRRASDAFLHEFERAHTFEAVAADLRRVRGSPFTAVYARAQRFIQVTPPALAPIGDRAGRLSGSQVEALRLVLDAETNAERDALSRFVPSLATIGVVSPLIGLLGTVLGVIDAFAGIAAKGSGNIAAVAPGIAQALVATAAALSVAIPAFFGYNLFASRLNQLEGELEGFGSELIALLVREGRV